jgi:hypothetical protein
MNFFLIISRKDAETQLGFRLVSRAETCLEW